MNQTKRTFAQEEIIAMTSVRSQDFFADIFFELVDWLDSNPMAVVCYHKHDR